MNEKLKNILKFALFLSLGVTIFIWTYSGQDTKKIKESLETANYNWILISLILAFISHISRAIRWNILIEPLGYKPSLANSAFAIFIMYVSNMTVPRSGEFVRCGIVNKYEQVPFSKLLGTVVIERIFDVIMLLIFLGIVLVTQLPIVKNIIEKNPGTTDKFYAIFNLTTILTLAFIFIFLTIGLYLMRNKIKKTKIYTKLLSFIKDFIAGIKTVFNMKRKFSFLFHTVLIWILYFMMIHVVFYSFDFTENINLLTSLTIFVMASFGMVFPSPGGIGSWHFMVIQTMLVYGIAESSQAGAFAFAAHGSMTLFLIIIGVISIILLPFFNKNKNNLENEKSK